MAGLPGSKRREVPAWEQRLTEAQTTLDVAQHALAVAQQRFEERLPVAEHEVQQMVDAQQRQLVALQRRIEERGDLIQRAKAVQAAERERREAEARAQVEVERPLSPPVTIQSLKAETARLVRGKCFRPLSTRRTPSPRRPIHRSSRHRPDSFPYPDRSRSIQRQEDKRGGGDGEERSPPF